MDVRLLSDTGSVDPKFARCASGYVAVDWDTFPASVQVTHNGVITSGSYPAFNLGPVTASKTTGGGSAALGDAQLVSGYLTTSNGIKSVSWKVNSLYLGCFSGVLKWCCVLRINCDIFTTYATGYRTISIANATALGSYSNVTVSPTLGMLSGPTSMTVS